MPARKANYVGDLYARRRERAARKRSKKPKYENEDRSRILEKVIPLTCSEPWTAAAVKAADDYGIAPKEPPHEVARRLAELGVYPPPAEHQLMAPCPAEKEHATGRRPDKLYPAPYVRPEAFNPAHRKYRQEPIKIACEDCHAFFLWESGKFMRSQGFIDGRWAKDTDKNAKKEAKSEVGALNTDTHHVSAEPVEHDFAPEVKAQLATLGLTPDQAELLILLARGYTQIAAAEVLGKSQAWACVELSKAMNAIARAGYVLDGQRIIPRDDPSAPRVRVRPTDPAVLDRMESPRADASDSSRQR